MEQKPLHGRYTQEIRNTEFDIVKTNRSLISAGHKVEKEGLIIVALEQRLPTRNYQVNTIKMDQTICRLGKKKKGLSIHHLCEIVSDVENSAQNPESLNNFYIHSIQIWAVLVGFYGISTSVGYLMPNPLYTYILNVYDLVWLGSMVYQSL